MHSGEVYKSGEAAKTERLKRTEGQREYVLYSQCLERLILLLICGEERVKGFSG